jgi:hypothetical protein
MDVLTREQINAMERCRHGGWKSSVCPLCDPHGARLAYAHARNILDSLKLSDAEIEEIVRRAEEGADVARRLRHPL